MLDLPQPSEQYIAESLACDRNIESVLVQLPDKESVLLEAGALLMQQNMNKRAGELFERASRLGNEGLIRYALWLIANEQAMEALAVLRLSDQQSCAVLKTKYKALRQLRALETFQALKAVSYTHLTLPTKA